MARLVLLLIASLVISTPLLSAAEPTRPNVIVINIDDLGYGDIGPFGSRVNRTPSLNRMAKEGRKLTSFYAAPVCSPSRAALMTGCYPKRVLPIHGVLWPGSDVGLSPGEVTVAEILKAQGYATAIVGKWHLGDQPQFLPNKRGFDLHFGLPYSNDMGPAQDGARSDLGQPLPRQTGAGQPPLPLLRNGVVVKRVLPGDQQSLLELYTTEAVSFITANQARPFFLYLAPNAVHFPVYPGRKWAGRSRHGLFSDWVEEVDWSVGQVLDAVRERGLSERTLVIFTSDNGGTRRSVNAPLRGHKGTTFEGGMRVPTIAWWPGQIPPGTRTDAILGMFDILPTVARLAGGKVPADRKIDGADIWPHLAGITDAKPAHETFYYYRGLRLEAVRHGDWKLQIASPDRKPEQTGAPFKPRLYDLKVDVRESKDIAAANAEVVEKLQRLAQAMKDDLGLDGCGPGCRELGWTRAPRPLIDRETAVRPWAGLTGLSLGALIALAVALVDALWLFSWRRARRAVPRVVAWLAVGAVGGFFGGEIGQLLYEWHSVVLLLLLSWVLTGLLSGAAAGMFDILRGWLLDGGLLKARRKLLGGVVAGAGGGLLAGVLYCGVGDFWQRGFAIQADSWSPSAAGLGAPVSGLGLLHLQAAGPGHPHAGGSVSDPHTAASALVAHRTSEDD
jgi:arylsulfatase A